MWKKFDLKQFLEKYGQDLNSRKSVEKAKYYSKNSQSLPEKETVNSKTKLNSPLKECNYCKTKLSIKNFEKHITRKCNKLPNNLNSIKDSEPSNKRKIKKIFCNLIIVIRKFRFLQL